MIYDIWFLEIFIHYSLLYQQDIVRCVVELCIGPFFLQHSDFFLDQVVAEVVLVHVAQQLRPRPSNGLGRLEDVVVVHVCSLLDAGIKVLNIF